LRQAARPAPGAPTSRPAAHPARCTPRTPRNRACRR
jgi:hypothetical protein